MALILHSSNKVDVDQLSDYIFLGACTSAKNSQWLINNKIKYVLNIGSPTSYDSLTYNTDDLNYMKNINYLKFDINDRPTANISDIFNSCFEFIDDAITNESNILIHCASGISRSSTICIAYFMSRNNWSFDTSYKYVKEKRFCINPNKGFLGQLQKYETEKVKYSERRS